LSHERLSTAYSSALFVHSNGQKGEHHGERKQAQSELQRRRSGMDVDAGF
jgi:hypothetical protein